MTDKTILVVGTYDTKNDELEYMVERITAMGGGALTMDVSVLGDQQKPTDISKNRKRLGDAVCDRLGRPCRWLPDELAETATLDVFSMLRIVCNSHRRW